MGIFGGSTPKPPKPPPPPELPASVASPDVQRAAMFSRVGSMAGFAGTRKSSGVNRRNPNLQTIMPGGGGQTVGSDNSTTNSLSDSGLSDPVVTTFGTGTPAVSGPPPPRVPAPDWSLYPKGTVGGTPTTTTAPVVKPKGKKKHKGK